MRKQVDVFAKHQISIAKKTLKLSDAGALILGGMTKGGQSRSLTSVSFRGGSGKPKTSSIAY